MWLFVVIGGRFELVAGILVSSLSLSVVSLLLHPGEMDVLEEDNPVLAVASSLLLLTLLLFHENEGLDTVHRNSPTWGSTDPIDASVPVLQYEIGCPIVNNSDLME